MRPNVLTILYLTMAWILAYSVIQAQNTSPPPSFHFEIFELPNGELGNHVQSIVQDSFGFMWFGSQNGLHRWDGYRFITYTNDPEDSSSITSNYVECIYPASDGTLWIGTYGNGLDRFDYATETFHHYKHDPDDPGSISHDKVTGVLEDKDKNLWMTTYSGVNKYDQDKDAFNRFLHDPEDSTSLSYGIVRAAFMDSQGTLWFGTGDPWSGKNGGGLNRYDPVTGSFKRYYHQPEDTTSLINNKVTALFEDSRHNFWVGTVGDGLHLMDRKTGKFRRLTQNKTPNGLSVPKHEETYDWHTRFIFEDRNKKIWIGAWLGGIKYYDPESDEVSHYFRGALPFHLPDNNIWNMFQAKDGSLWGWSAGIGNAKVFKIKKQALNFHTISLPATVDPLTFHQQDDQHLWVGTQSSGLLLINLQKKRVESVFKNDPQKSISHTEWMDLQTIGEETEENLFDNLWEIKKDREGYLWLAKGNNSKNGGLIRFHPEKGTIRRYLNAQDSSWLNYLDDMILDKLGYPWVINQNGMLYKYNPDSEYFSKFELNPDDERYSMYMNAAMEIDRNGILWIAGRIGNEIIIDHPFLIRFDPDKQVFQTFNNFSQRQYNEKKAAIYRALNHLLIDSRGKIWLNIAQTIQSFDPKTGEKLIYPTSFFGNSIFRGMTIDQNDRLWIIGDDLICFYPNKGSFERFDQNDGMIVAPFPRKAISKSPNGYIFIGGKKGIQYFDPNNFSRDTSSQSLDLAVTGFHLMKQSYQEDNSSIFTNEKKVKHNIRLKHDQNDFTVYFSALNFNPQAPIKYEYLVEGLHDNWQKVSDKPEASYYNVSPGSYTFRVRAAFENESWQEAEPFHIYIAPPWYTSNWAYGIYLLAICLFVYFIYRYQLNRKLAVAEAARLKELDAVKTQLYTNITHEFRTPLTVILGMARQVVNNPKDYFRQGMDMVIRNGENLLSLVNQMLDLSKLESGKMSLHLHQGDIINYLKHLVESFHSYAESQDIRLHFLTDQDNLSMDFDEQKIQQIVSNLLSNAIKFTPPGGDIYFTCGLLNQSTEHQFLLKIKDTGKGIPEEQLPHVFDRFYQVDNSSTREGEGTGIGLALTKELVKLMEGEIKVKSREGTGTEFIIHLPIRRSSQIAESQKFSQKKEKSIPASSTNFQLPTSSSGSQRLAEGVANIQHPASNIQPPPPASTPTILIAEDNPDVVQYLTACLAGDYRLNIAMDGQEGIDIAIETTPDLIISDVMMPHKDGFELCRTIKQDERTSHIPIIMLTAKADIESKLEGLEHGADAYLAKPFHKEELLIRIKKLLELRHQLQAYYQASAGIAENRSAFKDVSDTHTIEDQFVKRVHKVVEDNLDNFDFTVEQLCQEIHMSNSQLHRKLSALTGLSATKFIRYIKLNKAKELLLQPELTITAVAFDTGFQDPSYFGRVFKQEFGVTPQEWRERNAIQT